MSEITPKKRADFDASVALIRGTSLGRESTMYTSLRDILQDVLGYPRTSVFIDTAGRRGRPDLTVFAPGGSIGSRVSWLVVDAKAEKGAASAGPNRTRLYAEKAKYITADTAYIVMVDPICMVARGAGAGRDAAADLELDWDGCTAESFAEKFAPLREEVAGVPAILGRFRDGDESLIAYDALSVPDGAPASRVVAARVARNVFFDTLTETTRLLQAATLSALAATRSEREAILSKTGAFEANYGGLEFQPYPISVKGMVVDSREKDLAHRKAAADLRRFLVRDPALARLTLHALPRFAERCGLEPGIEDAKVERFFANETANLILARVLLIRFLEDHGFFDAETPDGSRRRRYLCNGGVAAFQGMRGYFGHGYTRLLEDAYRSGGRFYSAAFDETEMDWIIALSDDGLSRTVEWTLFRLARFDFSTARGDLMSGVYDRFLDRKQRKDQGEYYTPPSVARYILDRLALAPDARMLDPACGSGTFLIERYRQVIGDDADRGIALYADAKAAAERLYGNDLNPFSAVLTQIQLLWHLLSFGDEIRTDGFPELHVSERANSLVPGSLYDPTQGRFGEIDQAGYDAVAGNPPYIRKERSTDLESHAQDYFTGTRTSGTVVHRGIGVGSNAYTLFVYRALDHWCRQPGPESPPGRMGFIIPLAFCVSDEAADLRRLFEPGGRWVIREIVDMEMIWPEVFDADVLPMILIASAEPPGPDDIVSVRTADNTCVVRTEGDRRPTFDFSALPERIVRYADLFTPDGRIMPGITPDRAAILRKLWANPTLEKAAMTYWTRRGRGRQQVSATEPTGFGANRWQRQRLIGYGMALRRRSPQAAAGGGMDAFKGENVTTSQVVGDPAFTNLDPDGVSSPAMFAFRHILPDTAYAIPTIEQAPVAAPFNPRTTAMLNTVIVFAPRADLAAVPFDILPLSNVYVWFHAIARRRSYLNKQRGHIYPTTVSALPWNESLLAKAGTLHAIKSEVLVACEMRYRQAEGMRRDAVALGLKPLQVVVRATPGAKVTFTGDFDATPRFFLDAAPPCKEDETWTIALDEGAEHSITFSDHGLAVLAHAGLSLLDGEETSRAGVLRVPVPADDTVAASLTAMRASYEPDTLDARVDLAIGKLDKIIGEALGLAPNEVTAIQEDMTQDPFLRTIRPRMPFKVPRQYGRRRNLERANRYATE